ncbi:A-kinase anchor protein 14 isoform X1 [Mesocricetus auratus]|uniref:A-kinase anchor protein 14 isoform X1 n=1 Tax=Mesocricetus auratus TaxID=10036 RepID=A0A1U7RAL9_MESAU|nr:A-kinase anchor protein 14 isoform X1 [Mesocricetus auratus]
MDKKKGLPTQKVNTPENPSTAKTKKPDAPDPKNVPEPKDNRVVADLKKTGIEQKEKKTVTIATDPTERKSVSEPKERKTVMVSDSKDKKPETKDKRMVTFVTDIKDKRIVTDTKENKILSIDTKGKVVMPIVSEVKEKKIVPPVEPKEKVVVPVIPAVPVVPVVPEVKQKILVPEVKEKKEVPPVPEIKEIKGFRIISEIKEKKAVPEIKEKVPGTETKEKKSVQDAREKKPVVIEKKDEASELAETIVESAVAAAVEFVEESRNPVKNIKWITHGEFTIERGRKDIEKFVSTWEIEKRWVYHADFIEKRDLVHSFHYIYRVCWSAPTAVRPMARVSAYAYFTIKFNKSKPRDMPVDVSFIFENSRLLQRPGKIRFREQWLRDITETTQILLESIPFKVV